MLYLFKIFLRINFLLSLSLYAQSKISKIEFIGLEKTVQSTAEDFFGLRAGDDYSPEALDLAVQRVKNTQLFTWVIAYPTFHEKNVSVLVQVKEKFSLLPFVTIRGGNGLLTYGIGLIEANFLGRAIELAGRVSSFQNGYTKGFPLSGAFFLKWNLPHSFFSSSLEESIITVAQYDYTQSKNTAEILGYYGWKKLKFLSYFDQQYSNDYLDKFFYGIQLESSKDSFEDKILGKPQLTWNQDRSIQKPSESIVHKLSFTLSQNDLNYMGDSRSGTQSKFYLTYAFPLSFWEYKLLNINHIPLTSVSPLLNDWVLSQRLTLASQTLKTKGFSPYALSLGGLNEMRGYAENSFTTSQYALLNLELTYFYHFLWQTTLKPTVFLDAAWVNPGLFPWSSGLGLRWSTPRIYKGIIRLDLVYQPQGFGASFGINQFF